MPIVTRCPSCQRQLRVPDNLLGRKVKCPGCKETFTADADGGEPPPAPEEEAPPVAKRRPAPPSEGEESGGTYEIKEEPRERRRPPVRFDEEEDDEEPPEEEEEYEEERRPRRPRRRRSYTAPHRGTLIMTLGILSLVVAPIILGPIAWVMGNNDLKEIRAGRMDPEGEGSTNAGRICGMIATILACVSLLCCGLLLAIGSIGGALGGGAKH